VLSKLKRCNKTNKAKTNYATLSEQLKNLKKTVERGEIHTLTHKYMTTHLPGLVQALQ